MFANQQTFRVVPVAYKSVVPPAATYDSELTAKQKRVIPVSRVFSVYVHSLCYSRIDIRTCRGTNMLNLANATCAISRTCSVTLEY